MSNTKCESCGQFDRVYGERFCRACKKAVIAEIRESCRGLLGVRTLARDGTEHIGRKARPWTAVSETPD